MNILFACGGTAGHINPALAIAGELLKKDPDAAILFVGAGRDMEKRLIPDAGYDLVNIRMSGLKRGITPESIAHNVKMLTNLATASGEAAKIIRKFDPQIVIGTGGYVCYPVLKKAARMGIPTLIHESNAVPGLTTRLLSTVVDRILVSFPGIEKHYRRPERVVFTGTPVRGGFAPGTDEPVARGANGRKLILSFWGSLGAERMNEIMAEFIKLNIGRGEFDHIHATGRGGGVTEMRNRLKRIGVPDELPGGIEIKEYIDNMPPVMAAADIVLCRAGGSTIAELAASGKPAVLIPSPYVSNNEQEKNAKQLEKAGGAVMLDEKKCTGELLFNTVESILKDDDMLKRMSDAQNMPGVRNAAEKIAGLAISLVAGR